ncbi:CATRA system-associated protein [Micromonospora chalcea]
MSDHSLPLDLLDDLRDVLDDMDEWRLDPTAWAHVDTLLGRVEAALSAGKAVAIREAVADLELSGPTRAKSADSGATGRQPPKTRDKLASLKDTLNAPKRTGPGKAQR